MVNLESALLLINLCKCVIHSKYVFLAFRVALSMVGERLFLNAATEDQRLYFF